MVIQGRHIAAEEIALIRGLMAENPDLGRTRLSQELCRCWNWRNAKGRVKDMAARSLLLKLGETRGRTRNDRNRRIQAPVKDVYLYPLVPDFRKELCRS